MMKKEEISIRIVHQDCGQEGSLMVNADETCRKRGAAGRLARKTKLLTSKFCKTIFFKEKN